MASSSPPTAAMAQLRPVIVESDVHENALWSRPTLDDLRSIAGAA